MPDDETTTEIPSSAPTVEIDLPAATAPIELSRAKHGDWWRLIRDPRSNLHYVERISATDLKQGLEWTFVVAVDTDALDEPLAVLVQRYLSLQ